MATIEDVATAILRGAILEARALVQEIARGSAAGALAHPGRDAGADVVVVAAAMAELLADRYRWERPSWTASVGALRSTLDLLPAKSDRLRALLMQDVPEPLRKRNIFAPRGFLEHA